VREGLPGHRDLDKVLLVAVCLASGAEGLGSVWQAEPVFLRDDPFHAKKFLFQFGDGGLTVVLAV
jgi:hypothetical protein